MKECNNNKTWVGMGNSPTTSSLHMKTRARMEQSSFQGQEKDLNTRPITPILETQEATRSSLQPTKASNRTNTFQPWIATGARMMPAFMPNASGLANIPRDAREKVRHGSYSEGDPTYSFCCAQQSELMKGYLAVIDLCLRMLGHLISRPLPSIPPSLHPELTWPFHRYQPFFFKK